MRTKIEIALCLIAALVIVALSLMYQESQVAQSRTQIRAQPRGFEPIPDCAPGIVDTETCWRSRKTMR